MKKLIALLATALLAVSAVANEFPDLTIAEVKAAVAGKSAVILDVNGTESWRKGHVPGALDYAAVKDKLASVLPKDKSTLVIAYCGGPKCKAYQNAAQAAAKLGYTNVKHMSAGISGWQKAGEKMEKGS
jgi:rhodanese-related sulfurtransferase